MADEPVVQSASGRTGPVHSILMDTKTFVGYAKPYDDQDPFDLQLIMHINAKLASLRQIGVGPSNGFRITGVDETWEQFLVGEHDDMNWMVPEYVYCSVKLVFDPPASAAACDSLKKIADEDYWRMKELAEGAITNAGSNN